MNAARDAFTAHLADFMNASMRFGRDAAALDVERANPTTTDYLDHVRGRYDEAWEALKASRARVLAVYDDTTEAKHALTPHERLVADVTNNLGLNAGLAETTGGTR